MPLPRISSEATPHDAVLFGSGAVHKVVLSLQLCVQMANSIPALRVGGMCLHASDTIREANLRRSSPMPSAYPAEIDYACRRNTALKAIDAYIFALCKMLDAVRDIAAKEEGRGVQMVNEEVGLSLRALPHAAKSMTPFVVALAGTYETMEIDASWEEEEESLLYKVALYFTEPSEIHKDYWDLRYVSLSKHARHGVFTPLGPFAWRSLNAHMVTEEQRHEHKDTNYMGPLRIGVHVQQEVAWMEQILLTFAKFDNTLLQLSTFAVGGETKESLSAAKLFGESSCRILNVEEPSSTSTRKKRPLQNDATEGTGKESVE